MKKRNALRLLASALLIAGISSLSHADSITVTNYNSGSMDNPSTGTYVYLVTFDGSANVQGGDGFVIYDFDGETGYTLKFSSPESGTGSLASGDFVLSQQTTGNALTDSSLKYGDSSQLTVTDDTSAENLTFNYSGSGWTGDGLDSVTALLTITTSDMNAETHAPAVGVDHSGTVVADEPFSQYSVEGTTVITPATVPTPAGLAGGSALIGLLAIAQRRNAARQNAQ